MAKWFFEPGHTAAEFSVRHMMVTFVRGHFKNAHGTLVFDPANPRDASVEVTIDSAGIWTGEADRDAHLKSADFLDVEKHPKIVFKGNQVELTGATYGEVAVGDISTYVPFAALADCSTAPEACQVIVLLPVPGKMSSLPFPAVRLLSPAPPSR